MDNGIKSAINHQSSPEEKIALFRSLFRGREDVYPVRFVNRRTGKSGYSPACANEWVRGVCEKPRIRCAECSFRQFLPVTDEAIRRHLTGEDIAKHEFVMGIYPMLQDETCYFLALDFDKKQWRSDSAAFLQTCQHLSIPASLEQSRSGNGAHIWIFFAEAVPVTLARQLGSYLLTRTMEHRPEMGLDSYDRMFPNQDTLPRGGFGNLIALPLQKRARLQGYSVFLDLSFNPYPDQWSYLASIQKLEPISLHSLANEAELRGEVTGVRLIIDDEEEKTPWTLSPSRKQNVKPSIESPPANLNIVLADQIYIKKEELTPSLHNQLIRLAAFQNPEFYRAQAMRYPTFGKPRIISCAEDFSDHIALPRGCFEECKRLFKNLHIKIKLQDKRISGISLPCQFHGTLRPEQQLAADALLKHDTGVLAATTAFGKTVLAAWMIAQRGVNTLILVHRQQLLDQWVEQLSIFLKTPIKSIGRLGGGRKKLNGNLDVALIQSLVKKDVVDDRIATYGQLIFDECHHLSARSFELVARRAKARFILGLSATVTRKDGHHPIILMQCGPIRHQVSAKSQMLARPFDYRVLVKPTSFRSLSEDNTDLRASFQKLYQELQADHARNTLICNDVIISVKEGRSPLVLTERKEHLEELARILTPHIDHLLILQGGMGRKALRDTLEQLASLPPSSSRVILATGKFVGEGFDDPRLDTLFLTLPVSWRGTLAQYAGRLHRLHEGKREVQIYDYADLNSPMLSRMFNRRCRGYEAIGYTIQLPANAIQGWPSEITLPVDAEWKRDYSGSIQRLIQDGMDIPLANLFVDATQKYVPDATGNDRARSASEAFLYERLQTLSTTKGLFQLNSILPIPFDNMSTMEVDLYSESLQLAIELDGPHHFANEDSYRRDRRKDALLQQHDIFILRFLPEDLTKHLDKVLDMILSTIVNQRKRIHARLLVQMKPRINTNGHE